MKSKRKRLNVRDNPDFFSKEHYFANTAKNAGYQTYAEYLNALAKQRGYANAYEYAQAKLKQKGVTQTTQKKKYADNQGLPYTYDHTLELRRSERARNKRFAAWLKQCLALLGKNQRWLAGRLGIDESAMCRYVGGYYIPRRARLDKIRWIFAQYTLPHIKLPELPE